MASKAKKETSFSSLHSSKSKTKVLYRKGNDEEKQLEDDETDAGDEETDAGDDEEDEQSETTEVEETHTTTDEEEAEAERNAEALKARKAELAEQRRALVESRRVWTKKKLCCLFIFFIIATASGVGGIFVWVKHYVELSMPPTQHGMDTNVKSILAFVGLTVLAPCGLILIVCRISNLIFGIIYMFFLVLLISFAMTGLSRSIYSYKKDSLDGTMRNYYAKFYKDQKNVPKFYDKISIQCDCCGFVRTDRILEWPSYIESNDFPYGCCKSSSYNETKARKECAGLGYMHDKQRVPSGFMIITTQTKMEELRDANGFKAYPGFKISSYQNSFSVEWMKKIFKNLCDDLLHRGSKGKGKGKSPTNFCDKDKVVLNTANDASVPTGPVELQLLYDLLVDKWIAERIQPKKLKRGTWLYFELFLDDLKILNINSFATSGGDSEERKVYYVTQGIAENIILEKVIRPRRCEKYIQESKCNYYQGFRGIELVKKGWSIVMTWLRDKWLKLTKMDSKYRPKYKEPTYTSLHLSAHRMIVFDDAAMCVVVIVETLIMTILFWYFYSRLKANEQAALKPPTDFDLLNLELPDYDELDEAAKAQEREMLQKRLVEKEKRLSQERKLNAEEERRLKAMRKANKQKRYSNASSLKSSRKESERYSTTSYLKSRKESERYSTTSYLKSKKGSKHSKVKLNQLHRHSSSMK